jgi:cyanate lyase
MIQTQVSRAARQELADNVIDAKMRKGLSWAELSEYTDLSVVYLTASLLGQHPLSKQAAETVCKLLDLDSRAIALLQTIPFRGSIPDRIPTDPTIYRFYEMIQIYGTTLKCLVNEMFGDGIISAINFKMDLQKVDDPEGGSRAIVTLNGKFLPNKPF